MVEKDYTVLTVKPGDIITSTLTRRSYRVVAPRGDGAIVEDLKNGDSQFYLPRVYVRQFTLAPKPEVSA